MFVYELSGRGFESQSWVAVNQTSERAPFSSKVFLDVQASIEFGFTLKRVRDMIKTDNEAGILEKNFDLK